MSRTDGPPGPLHLPLQPCGETRLHGIPVSPGVATGPVFLASETEVQFPRQRIQAADIAAERARLEAAILRSRHQVGKLRARLAGLPEATRSELSPLLDAYALMLGPSRLVRGALARIGDRLVGAETAVQDAAQEIAGMLAAMAGDEEGARRQADEVREIGRRLIRNLTSAPFRSFKGAPAGAILVTDDLRPSDAALIDPDRIAGVATEDGGADGHAAIMLRALGVPAVLGAVGLTGLVQAGEQATLDGATGLVALRPSAETLADARRAAAALARERQSLGRMRRLPAETLDGERVLLQANLELPAELPFALAQGAQGIGLLRTEFLFMNRDTVPTEDEQFEIYRELVEACAGETVTIRALDWGGEKEIECLVTAGLVPEAPDPNPALGMRGIRLLLRQPALFEAQLAAILRASAYGPVQLLLPMVTCLPEVQQARAAFARVAAALSARGRRLPKLLPELGVMVETPGAALAADGLASAADFFALGTNDLAMYTLAVDRSDTALATLYDPLHPAVLRLIQFTVEAGLRHRRPVSVCGEIAGNPRFAPLLLGLGLRHLSMSAGAVARVKRTIRARTMESCIRLAWNVMRETDPARIPALLDQPDQPDMAD
jgi:phosphoenolpyruvate-protein phosphotransferase